MKPTSLPEPLTESRLFECIVCGIDDTPESLEAARQAARLRLPHGSLHLYAVADLRMTGRAGLAAAPIGDQIVGSLKEALARAVAEVQPTRERLAKGNPVPALLLRIQQEQATLLALGAHEHQRMAGMLMGSVGTALLRDAPCSVLLARAQRSGNALPRTLVVGVDGSPEAAAAVRVARSLRDRFGAELTVLTGLGGKKLDADEVAGLYPGVTFDARPPVDALVEASGAADLLVVGSRGLHGLQAFGSVSERVAHRAACSVLVVRGHEREEL